jgi:hypothetical protein
VLPPVSTEPPTAPTPAPIAVFRVCCDIPAQPATPSDAAAAIAASALRVIVFIETS